MNRHIKNKVVFIGKSMLWSLLLYITMMLVVYHDEVSNVITGHNAVAVITGTEQPVTDTPDIPKKQGVIKSLAVIVRTINGFASVSAGS